ncbi:MAG: hypothetical protein RIR11_3145 [Bacteroidota bacterium]|jgi:hypothetical protein
MKKTLLLLIIIAMSVSVKGQFLDTIRIQSTGLDGGVAISSDDAEQKNNEIDKLFDDDLDMGWEGDEFNIVSTGLRFRGIKVPKNAVIDSAYIEIFAHEDEGDLAKITIYAEAADNCDTYNETSLISDRVKTTAAVSWNIAEPWTIWNKYRSPELKSLIQEVVNRQNWKSGNALALMFFGEDQGANTDDNARDFEAFENIADPDDGGDGLNHPERIPKLYIFYSSPTNTTDLQRVYSVSVSPNPIKGGTFNLSLDAFEGETVSIALTDATGRTIQTWKQTALAQNTFNFPTATPAGVYSIEVKSAAKVAVLKIVKQ